MNEKLNARRRAEYAKRKREKCKVCENITTYKFCSQLCQSISREIEVFKQIEAGTAKFSTIGTANRWYKRYLIFKHGEKCMDCGWNKKHPKTLKSPIELEHCDGNSENNSLDNLKLLCPNCHSLTLTYRALNTGKGRQYRRERYRMGKSF